MDSDMITSKTYLTLCARWRYLILLGALLLGMVIQPIFFGFSGPPLLFDACLMLVTIALLFSFSPDKKKRLFAFGIGIPTALLPLSGQLYSAGQDSALVYIGHCLAVVFYFWAAVMIVASLVRNRTLSLDSIFGTICGYLLLGVAWGVLYAMLDTIWPGSFEIDDRLLQQVKADHSRGHLFSYYSFITLTTVGYGDVTPLSTPARTCAWLEALTGQFYLAVLVAGLVGALLARKTETRDGDQEGNGAKPTS
jgi:hypothetical protein